MVIVRTKALSQALFSLAASGCDTVGVSVVGHAVKVEGISEGEEPIALHVWSKEAEEVEEEVGKGRKLTEEEVKLLDVGKCPVCKEQLYKGPRGGLAMNVACNAGHTFWVAPLPFEPEYLGQKDEVAEEVKEEVEDKQEEVGEEVKEALEEIKEEGTS